MPPPHERSNLIILNRIILDTKSLGAYALASVYREYIRVGACYVVVFTRQGGLSVSERVHLKSPRKLERG